MAPVVCISKFQLKQIHNKELINVEGATSSVGRKNTAKIILLSAKVSRAHATLIYADNKLFIQDLKSGNGTYVNGKRIETQNAYNIQHSNIISFGLSHMFYAQNDDDRLCFFEIIEIKHIDLSPEPGDPIIQMETRPPSTKHVRKEMIEYVEATSSTTGSKELEIRLKDCNPQNNGVFILPRNEDNASAIKESPCNEFKVPHSVPSTSTAISPKRPPSNAFTTNMDNSIIIIDITEDDDDEVFECSQIAQMCEMIKSETVNSDEEFQKIKTEIAYMDQFDEEYITNSVPIALDEEMDQFHNTQDIINCLDDTFNDDKNDFNECSSRSNAADEEFVAQCDMISSNNSDYEKNDLEEENDDAPIQIASAVNNNLERDSNADQFNVATTSCSKFYRKPDRRTEKIEIIPPLKRKSTLPISKPTAIKQRRKSVPINPLHYDPKQILNELKTRNINAPSIDKKVRKTIQERRKQKLKELAGITQQEQIEETAVEIVQKINTEKRTAHTPNIVHQRTTRSLSVVPQNNKKIPENKRSKSTERRIKLIEIKDLEMGPHAIRSRSHISEHFKSHQVDRNKSELSRTDPRIQSSVTSSLSSISKTHKLKKIDYRNPVPKHDLLQLYSSSMKEPLPHVSDVINKMVYWLPNWLTEQIHLEISPPLSDSAPVCVPLNFDNFNHYYDVFSKLVFLEYWQSLCKGFESSRIMRKVQINHVWTTDKVQQLDCTYYITENELKIGAFFKMDDFLVLEYCVVDNKNVPYGALSFGFVTNAKRVFLKNNSIINVNLGKLCNGEPHTLIEFTVITRIQKDKTISKKKMPMFKYIGNVRTHLMLLRSIKLLEKSALCSMICSPQIEDYRIQITHTKTYHKHNLNSEQRSVVFEAASLCTNDQPGIYCIQGPPGTGKSTVIVNLVFQILFSYYNHQHDENEKPPLILLTAPSNTAVDNLVLKLVAFRKVLPPNLKPYVKCVREGPLASISSAVLPSTLEKLAEPFLVAKNKDLPEFKAANARKENLQEFTKKYFGSRYQQELRECENTLLAKSNIICTTLNSCVKGRLIDAARNRESIRFTCCIIDEATQCHEVESLLPIILGIDKIVLVGDPQQLNATIMNRDACKLRFEQSLFKRLASHFGKLKESPIKMLTEQYRMHPEICSFPNKQFYGGKLRTSSNYVNTLPNNIRRYLVFNCEKRTSSNEYTNMDEVLLIKKLLQTVIRISKNDNDFSVGIITPYNAQKDLIYSNIQNIIKENVSCKITVNTVDSFQGSENDIIIISMVRDNSNSFLQNTNRLNVALTRAKQALYITGNYTLFNNNRLLLELREDAKKRKAFLDIRQDIDTIRSFETYLLKK